MTRVKVKDFTGMTARASINYKPVVYNLYYVTPESLGLYWDQLDFKEALSHTHMTTADLKEAIQKGACDLFLAKDNNLNTYGGLVVRVCSG